MQQLAVYIILFVAAYLSYYLKKLTLTGAITGFVISMLIFYGIGYTALYMLAAFFIAGSAATGLHKEKKAELNAVEKIHGMRTAGQVWANGGIAALLGVAAWLIPEKQKLIELMVAGSFAAAIADTLSSELGTIYGSRFYNIITLRKDKRGLDGVISLEGTLIGIVGATLISLIYAADNEWRLDVLWIIIAGVAGNLIDSVLGATLERKGIISNNTVNFLNTLAGALICLALSII